MGSFSKITEQSSRYNHLERMSVSELLQHINEEIERITMYVGSRIWRVTIMDDGVLCHKRR